MTDDNGGRPKKFDDGYKVTSFKIEPATLEEAQRKAQNQGKSLSEVLRSYIRAYVGVNSPVTDLEAKKREVEEDLEDAKTQLQAIESQLEHEKSKVPLEYVKYYAKHKEDAEWVEEKSEGWFRESARNLGLDYGEFKKRLFNRLAGEMER